MAQQGEHPMNVLKLFEGAGRSWPRRPALLLGQEVLRDYAGLLRAVRQRATWLARLGLRPGDRLALCMGNRPEYLELLYASLWAGIIATPINTKLHPLEVDYVVHHCGAKVIISDHLPDLSFSIDVRGIDANNLPDASSLPESDMYVAGDNDVAWLFYTSGTTGRPKGAMLTHGNLLAMSISYRSDVEAASVDDAYIYGGPMSHGAGLYTFAYSASAARHVFPVSGGFDAAEILELSAALGEACMFLAPTMINRMVKEVARQGIKPSGIKSIVYGGSMYVTDIERALNAFGPRLAQVYGQGETAMTITCMTRDEVSASRQSENHLHRLGSVGRSYSVTQVRTVDDDGRPCAPGVLGEVVVRGPTVMRGYWKDEKATAPALRDGWLYTGDIGAFDADGFLTLWDRSKDVVISGGANIYPREVEEVLLEHPAIVEAAVIGAPDAEWGERVVAFVVETAGGATDEELDQLCLSRIARYKRPKEYIRVESLPKNHNGKVMKTTLRNMYSRDENGGPAWRAIVGDPKH
jgi:long-chain acyl-CoA synthetase